MPISVACQCGKRFQAKDELAGKRVKCPGCGNPLAIPTPQPAVAGELDDLFGPAGSDPLRAGASGQLAGFGPPSMPGGGQPRPRTKKGPNVVLIAGIAGGGVGLFLILIVVLLLVFGKKGNDQVAQNPAPVTPAATDASTTSPGVAAPTTNVTAPTAAPAPPVNETTAAVPAPTPTPSTEEVVYSAEDSAGNKVEITESSSAGNSASRTPLAKALNAWHGKADDKYRGALAREGKKFEDEAIVYQISWMSQLLPHLGYERIHKKFDFKKPWNEPPNYQAAQYRIPQFLAPGDDRKAWESYPFPNLALTHFVGMAGVEELRNDVAAAFDRTDDRAGIFGYTRIAKLSEITDGANQTIMLIGAGELIGPWVVGGGQTVRGARAPQVDEKTGEKTYDDFNPQNGFGTRGMDGPQTLFADGAVRMLNPKMDPLVFRALCTIHGKETVDLKDAGTSQEKFATQDFDPMKNESEIKITIVRRIGDGGDSSDDDDKEDGSSTGDSGDEGSGSDGDE